MPGSTSESDVSGSFPRDEQAISVDRGTQLGIALCLVLVVDTGAVPQPLVAMADEVASDVLGAKATAGTGRIRARRTLQ